MRNDGEYLRRLEEGEIHGEKLRFGWFWVGGLRGGERAAATQQEVREKVREEASSGLNWLTLIRKCGATQHGAAEATAAPPSVAPHLQSGARRAYVAARAASLPIALHHLLPRHRERRGKNGLAT
jgi:hypothetical protein